MQTSRTCQAAFSPAYPATIIWLPSPVCFLSAKREAFFSCLISCEGANYPAAYQLKTMRCAKGASIICEQRAEPA